MFNANTHGGNIWSASKRYNIAPDNFIDFSANINPLGPSPLAIEAMHDGIKLVQNYPDPEAKELLASLSQYLELPQGNLLLGNGGAEIIFALGRHLKATRLVLPVPTFSEYRFACGDVPVVNVPLRPHDNFRLPVEHIKRIVKQGDVIFVCNPNNPTGSLVSREDLFSLASWANKINAVLVVDEAFMDFLAHRESALPWVLDNPNLVVVGSLTKFFALPGLRLGYLAASSYLIEDVSKQLPPWRVNVMAQMAGVASFKDTDYIANTLKLMHTEKEFLYQELKNINGLTPYPPNANFILIDGWKTGKTSAYLCEQLGKQGILIRDASNFEGLNQFYFRIAVRLREENQLLVQKIKLILTKGS